ncbi:MAG: helix-turn-helix domain-containing protein [Ruminococcaceae bacterium]|nr:helix-turn-helix domain-containing protein [Oscillospiraceae bacterium]
MNFSKAICQMRKQTKLTQEQFAELFDVSQQAVQKWESGASVPDVEKIIRIAKYFDISLDSLLMDNDNRVVEEMNQAQILKPQYQNLHDWEFYSANLMTEFQQSIDEGLNIDAYKDIFESVSRLPKGEYKKKLGDVLFEIVISAEQKEGYPYVEPSDLNRIQMLRRGAEAPLPFDASQIRDKIYGAWLGRICGCLLGKSVEGIRTDDIVPFLKDTDNYPLHRYILHSDLAKTDLTKYRFNFVGRTYADDFDEMPPDDDTNYTVLAQEIVKKYGRNFTPYDVSRAWLASQCKDSYCTAERVAFCNFVKGYTPPQSAIYKNPYREWIGAQIRGDYFGYINPGDPKLAAEMAWRDASISHVKNGIYGEMFVAAMLAMAAVTNNPEEIILGGLAEIPHTSRLYEHCMLVVKHYQSGESQKACFEMIHNLYDEYTGHGWCHTISNAMVVVASLLYGEGDYTKSICMAVETGFDTDCNGATVGSVLGMAFGKDSIPSCWTDSIHDTLRTTIFGVGTVRIADRVEQTMKHLLP